MPAAGAEDTWWFIPLSKWVTTLVINGISGVSPLITGVITHLLSGMNHQVETGEDWKAQDIQPIARVIHFFYPNSIS